MESTGYSIDSDEYKETVANIDMIADEAVKYISGYVSHFTKAPLNERTFERLYRFTTLQYFHAELGIDNGN